MNPRSKTTIYLTLSPTWSAQRMPFVRLIGRSSRRGHLPIIRDPTRNRPHNHRCNCLTPIPSLRPRTLSSPVRTIVGGKATAACTPVAEHGHLHKVRFDIAELEGREKIGRSGNKVAARPGRPAHTDEGATHAMADERLAEAIIFASSACMIMQAATFSSSHAWRP